MSRTKLVLRPQSRTATHHLSRAGQHPDGTLRSASSIHGGTTIRESGTGGSNPVAPTIVTKHAPTDAGPGAKTASKPWARTAAQASDARSRPGRP